MKITFSNKDFKNAIKMFIENTFRSEIILGQIDWTFHRKAREISGDVEFDIVPSQALPEEKSSVEKPSIQTDPVMKAEDPIEEIEEEFELFKQDSDKLKKVEKYKTKLDTSGWGLFDDE